MKYHLLISLLFLSFSLFAQQKGVTPLKTQNAELKTSETYAVIVGISDYQDEGIPDLRFADKDAEAFAAHLQSPAGGIVPGESIKLLTNEEATIGNIMAAFTWLIDECQAGDRAIIYFSGHGDVEKVTAFKRGYLLAYDTPPTTYMAGAFEVRMIQDIISTLSQSDVEVVMVSDACRSGKLSGSEWGGAQATAVALSQKFTNEIKILSCQPDEFSLESEQWGGGRGCFSYHLIDGLNGLADRNNDQQVTLLEIKYYLEDIVPAEAAPQSQIPMTIGSPKTLLTRVDEEYLSEWKSQKAEQLAVLKPIESKGMEEAVLHEADSTIQQLYQAFLTAVKQGNLLTPLGKSADDYYRILIQKPDIAQLHGIMKRNFAAALQNEAQETVNRFLKTDIEVVSKFTSTPLEFQHLPAYLRRASEILGEGHFFFNHLKAKQLFFEGMSISKELYPDVPSDSLDYMAFHKMGQALQYDSAAAYVYAQLAYIGYFNLTQREMAIENAAKAVSISPNWLWSNMVAGRCHWGSEQYGKGEAYLLKALEMDTTFLPIYHELSKLYLVWGKPHKSKFYRGQFIDKTKAKIASNPEEVPAYYYVKLGGALWDAQRLGEAEEILLKAAEMTNYQGAGPYQYLGVVYRDKKDYKKAAEAAKKTIELTPNSSEGYAQIAYYYSKLNQPQKAEANYKKAIEINPSATWIKLDMAEFYLDQSRLEDAREICHKLSSDDLADPYEFYQLSKCFLKMGDIEAMDATIQAGMKKFPDDYGLFYNNADIYSLANNLEKAIEQLEISINKGYKDYGWMQQDTDLDNIRNTSEFKGLMKKYFPEQYKD